MKKVLGITNSKKIVVHVDKSLNKYDDVVLFPEKVAKANEMLKNTGLPGSKARRQLQ